MAEQQARAQGSNDQLKQQKRNNFVATPILKVRDLVNDANDETWNKQSCCKERSARWQDGDTDPNARAFNQRRNGGYHGFPAKTVQGEVIFNQSEKNVQQEKCQAQCYE